MPKKEIDYSNTIIYKIYCNDPAVTDVYVGHTTNFVQRKHAHKQSCINLKTMNYKCKVYEVIRNNGGWSNWKMEIVNFYNCRDHYEARKKEQEYFVSLNATLNSIEPMPKPKVIVDKVVSTSTEKFFCEVCDFNCKKESEYNRHLLTSKHINNCLNKNNEKKTKQFVCSNCSKCYIFRQSLYTHNKKCKESLQKIDDLNNSSTEDNTKLIEILINQNKEFKSTMIDLVKSNNDLQKQMLEICKNLQNK
jgi:hypothetical protein